MYPGLFVNKQINKQTGYMAENANFNQLMLTIRSWRERKNVEGNFKAISRCIENNLLTECGDFTVHTSRNFTLLSVSVSVFAFIHRSFMI